MRCKWNARARSSNEKAPGASGAGGFPTIDMVGGTRIELVTPAV